MGKTPQARNGTVVIPQHGAAPPGFERDFRENCRSASERLVLIPDGNRPGYGGHASGRPRSVWRPTMSRSSSSRTERGRRRTASRLKHTGRGGTSSGTTLRLKCNDRRGAFQRRRLRQARDGRERTHPSSCRRGGAARTRRAAQTVSKAVLDGAGRFRRSISRGGRKADNAPKARLQGAESGRIC